MPALSDAAVWQTFHAPWSARATGLVWPILAVSLVACDHVTPSPPNVPTPALPTVTTVTITGLPTTLTVGQTAQLTASATLPDGTRLNAAGQVTWQSSAISVVTVSATGLLMVVASGEADVTATLQTVRGIVHVVVAKSPPLASTYDISGVVHESAPTENVLLSGATVGIHFAGCPTCPHEGQKTTTDAQGRFTLPGIDTAGFTLWVQKPGYEATPFNIAMLPRDLHPDIGSPPSFVNVSQVFEDTYHLSDCVSERPEILRGRSSIVSRPWTFLFTIEAS